jgi:hypothetical protein
MSRRTDEAAVAPEPRRPEDPGSEACGPDDRGSEDSVVGAGGTPSTVEFSLGERDRAILEFERQWWKHAGAKEQAIRDRFGLSATRYYQLLNGLLDQPAALAHDPVLVQRLRRLRSSRNRRTA